MKSIDTTSFFSCSFSEIDKPVIDPILALCNGLDIATVNVDRGFSAVPAKKALELITETELFIAVLTKRTKISDNKYSMPSSVREEIAMAYALKKPILIFADESVDVDGMLPTSSTYYPFDIENIFKPINLEKILSSLHQHKLSVLDGNVMLYGQSHTDFICDSVNALFELKHHNSEFLWDYTLTREITYTHEPRGPIKTGVWGSQMMIIPDGENNMDIEFSIEKGIKDFSFKEEILVHNPSECQMALSLVPNPSKGDSISYITHSASKFLCPIYKKDIAHPSPITVGGKEYLCYDGVIPIQRTKKLHIKMRFPKEYQLLDIPEFFAGSYSSSIDYILDSEKIKAEIKSDKFGQIIDVEFSILNPLMNVMYGFCWNPPS